MNENARRYHKYRARLKNAEINEIEKHYKQLESALITPSEFLDFMQKIQQKADRIEKNILKKYIINHI